jgi:competence protein ComEC
MQFAAKATPPFLIAFLVGIFFSSYVFASFWFGGFLLLMAFALMLTAFTSSRRNEMFLVSLCVIGVALGIFRFTLWDKRVPDVALMSRVNTQVVLVGVVDADPDVREGNTHLTIALRSLEGESDPRKVFGSMLITVPRYPDYEYGDELRITGKLMLPKKFSEEDGRVFDYPSYLASKGIGYQMSFAQIDKTSEGKGSILVEKLFFIKKQFGAALTLALPEPHNALLGGLLLGGKQSLGEVWLERFRVAGIVHIVVLSGYNMTIVAAWLAKIFRFTGFAGSLSAGAIGIILFAIMTGAGATVVRAAIMANFVLLARATGRTSTMGRALLLAGAFMVLHSPSILAFDPSFQLSFLASLGLVYITPIIEAKTALFKRYPVFREVFVTTCATQIAVLPLLLAQTGMLSLVSLPVNLLVLPVIPLTMFFGFVAGVVSFVFPPLALIVGLPAHVLLSWILSIALYSSRIPFAALHVPNISSLVTLFIYVLLALWLVREHRKRITASVLSLPQSQEGPLLHSAYDKTEKQ